jgi:hypothetical protein
MPLDSPVCLALGPDSTTGLYQAYLARQVGTAYDAESTQKVG